MPEVRTPAVRQAIQASGPSRRGDVASDHKRKRSLAAIDLLEPGFNEIDAATLEMTDECERREFRRTLGDAIRLVAYELTMKVVHQYSDLDPDGDRYKRPSPGLPRSTIGSISSPVRFMA
jgi:hypothetical protein